MRLLLIVLFAVAPLAMCSARVVEGKQVDADPRRRAREHFERGRELQNAGDFNGAIAEYAAGYALIPLPEFLFNIAQCYRLLGNKTAAIDYYERYVEAAPSGKGSSAARMHVQELQKQVQSQEPTESTDSSRQSQTPGSVPSPVEKREAVKSKSKDPATLKGEMRKANAHKSSRTLRIASLSLIGAGVLSGAGGLYLAVHANGLARELSITPADDWSAELTAKNNEYERARSWSTGLFIAGGVLAISSATTYWLASRADDRMLVSPMLNGRTAGVTVSGHF
jgi:tetratricopeptide (TPR) repeat protein